LPNKSSLFRTLQRGSLLVSTVCLKIRLGLLIAYRPTLPTDSDSVFALIWLYFDLTLNYQSIVFPFKGYSTAILRRIAYNQRLWSYDHMALYKCVYYYYY